MVKTVGRKLVVDSAVRVVELDKLNVDPSYQREVKRKHNKIVADFNKDALGIVLIAQREDLSLWIVDGLQRISALKKLNYTTIKAEVFASSGPEYEAEVFKLVNIERTRLNPQEEFRALLAAGDEQVWAIKEAVEEMGFELVMNQKGARNLRAGTDIITMQKMEVGCLTTLRNVASHYGIEAIKFGLLVNKTCWPGDVKGVINLMMQGLAIFYHRHEGLVDMERLTPRFSAAPPSKIIYTAQQQTVAGDRSYTIADVLEKLYKKRMSPRRGT